MSISAEDAGGRVRAAEFGWPGGVNPEEPQFVYEALPEVAARLGEFLRGVFAGEIRGEVEIRGLQEAATPAGRYRARAAGGQWFLKLTARPGDDRLEQALTQFLAARGAGVAPLLAAGRLEIEGGKYRVQVQPLIEGRHFNGSEEDLRAAAESLRACHEALRDFPEAAEVRAAAGERLRRLREAAGEIAEAVRSGDFTGFAEAEDWARANAAWLGEMGAEFDPGIADAPGAQVLHSQPHPGNVLFERSGRAVLVDFEESVRTYAPPAWDLAYFVQRFCLRDAPGREMVRRRVGIVREAYGVGFPAVVPAMRQTSWFSIAILVSRRRLEGVSAPLGEYEKFVRLERQAAALEGEIDG